MVISGYMCEHMQLFKNIIYKISRYFYIVPIINTRSDSMSYVLIEFDDGGGSVAVVRSTWLTPRKREVFWPPVKDQKTFNKILESVVHAHTATWKLYPVQRCLFETDDLQRARQKCKLSEETSDLQTDNQEADTYRKRKRVVPRRFLSSDEDENDNDDVDVRPPKLKNKFLTTQKTQEKKNFRQTFSPVTNLPDEDSSNADSLNVDSPNASDSPNRDFYTQQAIQETLSISRHNTCNTSSFTTDHTDGITEYHTCKTGALHITPTNSSTESTVFQEKVIRLLSHLKAQNSQVLALLQNKEVLPSHKDFAFQFPMKSFDDVNHVEDILKEKTQIDILDATLSTIGGRDVSSKVSRILKYLFIDTLAAEFSFFGKRLNKRPFSDLYLRTIIVESIKRSTPGVTIKEIEDSIKIWLKHAPDREKNQMRRASRNNRVE
ncbi:uncharacterized protein [Linepithema humile]|uniref:uncharacterized protein isoform X2 n=1 Tax=Linepithema humile TaxID=83485 RepID=UPI00351E4F2E